jgi:ribonuclease HII
LISFDFENRARLKGFKAVAGVDEAGRGPLAGPVVAAACLIFEEIQLDGVNDSKQLTAEQRARAYEYIVSHPRVCYAVGVVEADEIDRINILQATFKAMRLAVERLPSPPSYILVDGNRWPGFDVEGETIVGGDALSYSIAAASIIAKETRDRLMTAYHATWPMFRFDRHKGYGTAEHFEEIEAYGGPCPIHRLSFAPFSKKG